jgi:hypothetical protein
VHEIEEKEKAFLVIERQKKLEGAREKSSTNKANKKETCVL